MFAELMEWLTTPCPAAARRLGYLREAIAIRARYRRHHENWRPHLDATRAFAQRAAATIRYGDGFRPVGKPALTTTRLAV